MIMCCCCVFIVGVVGSFMVVFVCISYGLNNWNRNMVVIVIYIGC